MHLWVFLVTNLFQDEIKEGGHTMLDKMRSCINYTQWCSLMMEHAKKGDLDSVHLTFTQSPSVGEDGENFTTYSTPKITLVKEKNEMKSAMPCLKKEREKYIYIYNKRREKNSPLLDLSYH
jgi:hypothetical protein